MKKTIPISILSAAVAVLKPYVGHDLDEKILERALSVTLTKPTLPRVVVANERYVTVQEAAARLAAHPKTVIRWLISGQLSGRRAGKRGRWRVSELDLNMAKTKQNQNQEGNDDAHDET